MKLSYIREFLALAANKNFSKTAEELYMAQSALSRHIAAMENELGVQLINRSTTTFELTEDGIRATEGFQKVLSEYQNTLQSFSIHTQATGGVLRLGVLYYDIYSYISKIRKVFRQTYPNISIKLLSYQPEQAEQALFDDEVDAIIAYNASPDPADNLKVFPFLKVPVYVFFSKEHPLHKMAQISVTDLQGEPLIVPPTQQKITKTKQIINRIFEGNGITPGREIFVTNFDEIPALVQENKAVYISPMAVPTVYQEEIAYLPLGNHHAEISLVWKAAKTTPIIEALKHTIKIAYS